MRCCGCGDEAISYDPTPGNLRYFDGFGRPGVMLERLNAVGGGVAYLCNHCSRNVASEVRRRVEAEPDVTAAPLTF